MAYDFNANSIVDPKAIDDVNRLGQAFDDAMGKYSNLLKALSGGVKINPKTIEELNAKIQQQSKIEKELIETQNQLSKLQDDYKKILLQVNQQIKDNTKSKLDEAKATKNLADAELVNQKAKTETSKQAKLAADTELANQKTKNETLKQDRLINLQNKNRKATEEEVTKALNTQVQSITQAREQNKILTQSRNDLTIEDQKSIDRLNKLNAAIDKNNAFIKKNTDSYTQQKMRIGDYKKEIKNAISELAKGELTAKNFGNAINGVGGVMKSSLSAGINQVNIGLGTMIKGYIGAQAILNGIQKFIGQIKIGINAIVDFEAANSKLAAILGTTSKNIKDLTTDAQRLGAVTRYTASQAAELQIELAKLGFSRQEILDSTEAVLKFAQATGSGLGEAAALAGAALRMFGAEAKEAERYVSAMAIATTKSAMNFSTLQTALPIAGSVAKQFGFEIEDVLALLGTLSDAGVDASSAATATRNILLNLANDTGKLSKVMGGGVKTFEDFSKGLRKVKDDGIQLAEMLEVTDKRSVNAFARFVEGADKIEILRKSITGVEKDLGVMAETMEDNVQGAIYGLESAWEAFALSFMSSTGPMKDFINWIAKGIRSVANNLRDAQGMISGVETETSSTANLQATNELNKAEEEFIKRRNNLISEGYEESKANEIALNELRENRIDLTAAEYKENERLRELAIIATQSFKDQSYVVNGLSKMFGFVTKETKTANKATLDYTKDLMELKAGELINEGIDTLIEKYTPKDKTKIKPRKLTDKEKKERLKIQKEFQNSELSLMDEGFEKELSKIRLNYSQKIASIIGYSEEEQKTRENLAKEMQTELDKYAVNYSIEKEKTNIQNKLDVVRDGSKEEMDLTIELLEYQMWQEMDAAEKTGANVLLIEEKYNNKKQQARGKYANEQNRKIQDQYAQESTIATSVMQEELGDLEIQYRKGLIGREQYEKKKLDIISEYAIDQAQAAVSLLEEQLSTEKLSTEERESLEKQRFNAKVALYDAEVKARQDADNLIIDSEQRKLDAIANGIKTAGDFLSAFTDLGSALFDRRIKTIEEEQEANQLAYEQDVERIENLANKGVITTEEAEARKRAAEDQTAAKEAELAKKKADLQTRQAKLEKANSIVQIALNTAVAIMRAWSDAGPFGGPVFAAIIGALGAVQMATAIAQPIPKYKRGTKDHTGGPAVVGDGGKAETVILPTGQSWITPSVPTLIDIPKGTVVLPEKLSLDDLRNFRSDSLMIERGKQEGIYKIDVHNDYSALEKEMKDIKKLLKNQSVQQRKAAYDAAHRYNVSQMKPI